MAELDATSESASPTRGGRAFRRLRLFLYITLGVCAALAIPGIAYVVAVAFGAGINVFAIIGALILAQFLLVLIVPPFRRRLFRGDQIGSARGSSNRPDIR